MRRVFRLYPMYLCVVLIQTAIMLALLPDGPFSELPSTLRYLAANMLLANFLQYDIGGVLSGLRNPGINPSLWTLKIEIGFYLIVPLIYVATRRWGWMVLALIFAASVAYSFEMLHLGDVRLARQLPGQLQFFVVGMALSLYGERLHVHPLVSVVIAIGFFAVWSLVEPIPSGIRPLIVAAFVFSFAFCPADRPTGIRHVVQRLSAAWPAAADPDPHWRVPRQTLVSCGRSVRGAWPGVRHRASCRATWQRVRQASVAATWPQHACPVWGNLKRHRCDECAFGRCPERFLPCAGRRQRRCHR